MSTKHWRRPERQSSRLRPDWSTLLWLYTASLAWQWRRYTVLPVGAALGVVLLADQAGLPHPTVPACWIIFLGAVIVLDATTPDWWANIKAREARWAACRAMARRWTMAWLRVGLRGADPLFIGNPYPKARDVEMGWGGNFVFTVEIPAGLQLNDLRKRKDRVGGIMGAKDVLVDPHPSGNLNRAAGLVVYASLPVPIKNKDGSYTSPLVARPAPMADGNKVRTALGYLGWDHWCPDDLPHATVKGPTGSGKTVLGRYMALQWEATPNHRLVLIDPKDGADTDPIGLLPYAKRLPFMAENMAGSLVAILAELADAIVYAGRVQQVCKANHCSGWAELPDEAKRRNPRRLIYFEELTTGLMKAPDEHADVLKAIGAAYAKVIRSGRSGGVNTLTVDQVTLSEETHLPSSALTQMEYVVAMGVASRHAESICGVGSSELSELPKVKARCLVGQRGRAFVEAQAPYLDHPSFVAWCQARHAGMSKRQAERKAKQLSP